MYESETGDVMALKIWIFQEGRIILLWFKEQTEIQALKQKEILHQNRWRWTKMWRTMGKKKLTYSMRVKSGTCKMLIGYSQHFVCWSLGGCPWLRARILGSEVVLFLVTRVFLGSAVGVRCIWAGRRGLARFWFVQGAILVQHCCGSCLVGAG